MKKALKVIGIVLASLALIFLAFVVVNQICEGQMNKYIDTFAAVEVEEPLTPTFEDGETIPVIISAFFIFIFLSNIVYIVFYKVRVRMATISSQLFTVVMIAQTKIGIKTTSTTR